MIVDDLIEITGALLIVRESAALQPSHNLGGLIMGFNTTVVVLNDHLSDIRDDKDFGRKLHDACLAVWEGSPVDLGVARVVCSEHADSETVVVVSGNTGRVLNSYAPESRRVDAEHAERILRNLAEMYGYKLVKKRSR